MHPLLTFFLGAYATGAGFSYFLAMDSFSLDRTAVWKKRLFSAGIALLWPVPAAIAGLNVLRG